MYQITDTYRAAMSSAIQQHRLTGRLLDKNGAALANISDNDFLKGSVSVTNQCSDSTDIKPGAVYVGTFKATLINTLGQTRGAWRGKLLEINFGMYTGTTFEDIPVGIYRIDTANWTDAGVEIIAYDNMTLLDKDLPAATTSGYMYDIIKTICEQCGVEYGLTRSETEALPNGDIMLGMYSENDCKTYRDIISWIAQTAGGFATINRAGKLIIKSFTTEPVFTFDAEHRLTGSKFSDFVTKYTGLSVVDMATKETKYYHAAVDDGATINLGSNPFLQYGIAETVDNMRRAVLDTFAALQYTPFNSSMLGNPAFDLGDVILYTDGIADDCQCCIMQYEWRLKQTYAVKGFGSNPALVGAQSKTDKDINGITKSSDSNELIYFSYVNSSAYDINTTPIQISNLRFSNNKETTIETWTEIQLETMLGIGSDSVSVQAFYYFDGELVAYSPIETYHDSAPHILGLHWFQYITEIMPHTWAIKLQATGGSISIDPANVHTLIKGQGMSRFEAWDGTISVSDVVGFAYLDGLEAAAISEEFSITTQTPTTITISEMIPVEELKLEAVAISEEFTIELKYHDAVPFVGEQYTGEPITASAII